MNELPAKFGKQTTLRRIMREAQDLQLPTEEFYAQPLENNLFEWHFTLKGAPDSPFDGGFYHGKLILPNDYPIKPPNIVMLTPNGRFETNRKICLNISSHHPETWKPYWSIRTALLALIAFMPTESNGAIGSLDSPEDTVRQFARESIAFVCSVCGPISNLLKKQLSVDDSKPKEFHGDQLNTSIGTESVTGNKETESKMLSEEDKESSSEVEEDRFFGDNQESANIIIQEEIEECKLVPTGHPIEPTIALKPHDDFKPLSGPRFNNSKADAELKDQLLKADQSDRNNDVLLANASSTTEIAIMDEKVPDEDADGDAVMHFRVIFVVGLAVVTAVISGIFVRYVVVNFSLA